MPPFAGLFHLLPREASASASAASEQFAAQWTNPGDVFSVLLILGGDVIGRALAQVAGTRWVAYSVSTVVSAVGENKLMPVSDFSCKVINGKTGHVRDNASWIIGRLVRDFAYWKNRGPGRDMGDDAIQRRVDELLDEKWKQLRETADKGDAKPPRPAQAGLCVSVFEAGLASKSPRLRGPLAWIGV
ncbi:hypothetical protein E4U42_001190, partial [Claviceps africana]